jgi:hypothetical protein
VPTQPRSYSQFGDDDVVRPQTLDVEPPMALGSSTAGSFQQRTAWRTPRGGQTPLSYSKRTAGTTFKFDDDSSPNLPRSDKGVGRGTE